MISQVLIPYTKFLFNKHSRLKNSLLDAISRTQSDTLVDPEFTISSTDWNTPEKTPRPYLNLFRDNIESQLQEVVKEMGFDRYEVHGVWFQQYTQNASHLWHNHPRCHYSCIYYLELPNNSARTQFIDTIDQQSVFEIDVEEGDVLIIPSMIKHRSPPVVGNIQKTVIVFNMSVIHDNGK
jgi:uncharacterized protein YjlB